MKQMTLFLGLLMLAACQTRDYPITSPFYLIPLGSHLVLHQDITIPANRARALIQNGHILERRDIDQYYPFCEFEILTLKDTDQVIKADTFTIHKLDKRMETSSQPIRYASLVSDRFESRLIAYNTQYYLHSDRQPDVYRLMCLYWTDNSMDNHLTHDQIQQALGKLFSFVIRQ